MRFEILRKEMRKLRNSDPFKFKEMMDELLDKTHPLTPRKMQITFDTPRDYNELVRLVNNLQNEFKYGSEFTAGKLKILPGNDLELTVPHDLFIKMRDYYVLGENKESLEVEFRVKPKLFSFHVAAPFEAAKFVFSNAFLVESDWKEFIKIWKDYPSYSEILDYSNRNAVSILRSFLAENDDISLFDVGIRILNIGNRFTNLLIQGPPNEQALRNIGNPAFAFPLDQIVYDLKYILENKQYGGFNLLSKSLTKEQQVLTKNESKISEIKSGNFYSSKNIDQVLGWLGAFIIAKMVYEGDEYE